MRLKKIYLLLLYYIITIVASSEIYSPKNYPKTIKEIDAELELRKSQIEKLEYLRNSILTSGEEKDELRIGLALSGGGSKGFAHIGVLRVLEENNIPIHYISGTSMGAIVAGLYSAGYTPDEIEVLIKTMDWDYRLSNDPKRVDIPLEEKFKSGKYFASMTFDNQLNLSFPKGVLSGEKSYLKLKELFWDVKDIKSFNELDPVLRIVVTDFNTGEAVTFDRGDLAQVISASMAIPTVFEPVKIGNRIYVDGMVAKNLPVEDLFEIGADVVIASDVGTPQIDMLDYNLLTVVSKMSSYKGIESTNKQRKLATVVIDPDVKLNDPSDFDDFNNLILQGELATKKKLVELEKYVQDMEGSKEKSTKENEYKEEQKGKKIQLKSVYIDKIKIENADSIIEKTITDLLVNDIPNEFNYDELESLMMKLYAMPHIDKAYYTLEGSTLVVAVDENELNHIRVGANYNADLGAKIAIGTDLSKVGKVGRTTSLEVELGSYNSFDFSNFWYYGEKNKIGINLALGYEEEPLFFYKGKDLKGESKDRNKYLDLGVTTRILRQFDLSGGLRYVDSNRKAVLGNDIYKDLLEDSNEYQEFYLGLIIDRKNMTTYPTNGGYIELRHEVGGIGSESVEYYSESGVASIYTPISSKLSLNGSLSLGMIDGGAIPLGSYYKIGGTKTNLKEKYMSFYGYNMMRKLASKFVVGQVGFQYMLYENFYLLGNVNILTYGGVERNNLLNDGSEFFEDYKTGYGLTLGYKSIIGPMEISITNDADYGEGTIIVLNLGYIF